MHVSGPGNHEVKISRLPVHETRKSKKCYPSCVEVYRSRKVDELNLIPENNKPKNLNEVNGNRHP